MIGIGQTILQLKDAVEDANAIARGTGRALVELGEAYDRVLGINPFEKSPADQIRQLHAQRASSPRFDPPIHCMELAHE
jgi:hypothetical protein